MPTTTSNAVQRPAAVEHDHVRRADALAEQVDLGRAEQQHVDIGDAGALRRRQRASASPFSFFFSAFSDRSCCARVLGVAEQDARHRRWPAADRRLADRSSAPAGAMSTRPQGAASAVTGARSQGRAGLCRPACGWRRLGCARQGAQASAAGRAEEESAEASAGCAARIGGLRSVVMAEGLRRVRLRSIR